MSTETGIDIFSGFNTTNPDQLTQSLMKLFRSIIRRAEMSVEEKQHVASVLNSAEFIASTNPMLRDRMNVIISACLDSLHGAYLAYSGTNSDLRPLLKRYKRI